MRLNIAYATRMIALKYYRFEHFLLEAAKECTRHRVQFYYIWKWLAASEQFNTGSPVARAKSIVIQAHEQRPRFMTKLALLPRNERRNIFLNRFKDFSQ